MASHCPSNIIQLLSKQGLPSPNFSHLIPNQFLPGPHCFVLPILRFLKCRRFVLVIGSFLLVVSFFQNDFSPHLCMIGFSHMGLREPLHDQLSRRARPLPAPQPLVIPLTLFFSNLSNTIWRYIVYLMARLEA